MSQQRRITDDLDALLGVLPATIVEAVHAANNYDKLLEIILDLGRVPTARFVDNEITLRETEVTREELDHVIEHIPGSSALYTASPPSATGVVT